MPFITEEIYQSLPHSDESIMISEYPKCSDTLIFHEDEEKMNKIIDAIRAIRARRSEMNVPPSKKAKVFVETNYTDVFGASSEAFFVRLASASELIVRESFDESEVSADNAVQIITDSATIYLPLSDIIDFEKEKARLEGEKKKLLGEIERLDKKLSNEGFVAKAPAAVIDGEKAKLAKYKENLEGVEAALAKLK
jgi:valyl-tRNA synthetase